MSLNQIERWINRAVRVVLKNPKLRNKDIMEWKNVEIQPRPMEVVIKVRALDMDWWVAVPKTCDKRKKV